MIGTFLKNIFLKGIFEETSFEKISFRLLPKHSIRDRIGYSVSNAICKIDRVKRVQFIYKWTSSIEEPP